MVTDSFKTFFKTYFIWKESHWFYHVALEHFFPMEQTFQRCTAVPSCTRCTARWRGRAATCPPPCPMPQHFTELPTSSLLPSPRICRHPMRALSQLRNSTFKVFLDLLQWSKYLALLDAYCILNNFTTKLKSITDKGNKNC